MYVWYLPEFLLMIAEEDVINKLVETRRLIQEQDIEAIHSKLPGKVIKLKIAFVRLHLSMVSHSGHLFIGLSISINASVFSRLGLKPSRVFLI
jgi:ubiquinone biosynthesis protein UbiJ